MELKPGLAGEVRCTVVEADTALALGSGDVPVLGTPRVLALAEAATLAALDGALPDTSTTVGTSVALRHRVATAVGGTVRARAVLTDVDGTRLVFAVAVHEGETVVADGSVERAVVDRARFLRRVLG